MLLKKIYWTNVAQENLLDQFCSRKFVGPMLRTLPSPTCSDGLRSESDGVRRSPTDSYGTFFGTGLRKIHSPMGLFPTVFVQLTSDSVGLRCWTHRSPMESDGTNVTLSYRIISICTKVIGQ